MAPRLFPQRKFVIEPHAHNVRQVGVMGTFDVFANVLLLHPNISPIGLRTDPCGGERGGTVGSRCSRLPNDAGLVFKVLGQET